MTRLRKQLLNHTSAEISGSVVVFTTRVSNKACPARLKECRRSMHKGLPLEDYGGVYGDPAFRTPVQCVWVHSHVQKLTIRSRKGKNKPWPTLPLQASASDPCVSCERTSGTHVLEWTHIGVTEQEVQGSQASDKDLQDLKLAGDCPSTPKITQPGPKHRGIRRNWRSLSAV